MPRRAHPDANTPDPSARWKFALDVQRPELTVERAAMPAKWEWPLAAPLKLQAKAVEIAWNPDPKAPRLPLLPDHGRKHCGFRAQLRDVRRGL